jgi:hypothetical protein
MSIFIVNATIYVNGIKSDNYIYPFYYDSKEKANSDIERYIQSDLKLGSVLGEKPNETINGEIKFVYHVTRLEYVHA